VTALPAYVNSLFLFLIASIIAITHYPIQRADQYLSNIAAMIACHEALIQYADQNTAASGTVPAASVDAFLPPGIKDPQLFTYVIQAPGTVATFLTSASLSQNTVILMVQKLSTYSVLAGVVSGGSPSYIVPAPPAQQVQAISGIPAGTIAIQTILRNNN